MLRLDFDDDSQGSSRVLLSSPMQLRNLQSASQRSVERSGACENGLEINLFITNQFFFPQAQVYANRFITRRFRIKTRIHVREWFPQCRATPSSPFSRSEISDLFTSIPCCGTEPAEETVETRTYSSPSPRLAATPRSAGFGGAASLAHLPVRGTVCQSR